MLSVVEYRCDEHRVRLPVTHPFREVVETSGASGSDDRYGYSPRDGPCERDVIARLRPVLVHARKQYFARASSICLTSSIVLTPPPTVRGTNTSAAVLSTTSIIVFLSSCEAVMSRKQISSAPSSLYFLAISTGSPASLRLTKLTPLTTLPSLTSRHAIILFDSITSTFL